MYYNILQFLKDNGVAVKITYFIKIFSTSLKAMLFTCLYIYILNFIFQKQGKYLFEKDFIDLQPKYKTKESPSSHFFGC